jgi:hypothetical protein
VVFFKKSQITKLFYQAQAIRFAVVQEGAVEVILVNLPS